jgi:small subunit ribosomal protein S20
VFVAHSLSSKKRVRQNARRRALNRARRTALRTRVRKCQELLQRGDAAAAPEVLRQASEALDRAANRRTIHRNAAARRKSRLAKKVNAMKAKGGSGA